MKIWLSKNSEVPVREQLVTQITLGIISGDLPVGERIPSTREISRRFQIHANTVGAAYQKLTEQGLIEFKKGSGFYVCETKQEDADHKKRLDELTEDFFRTAQLYGYSKKEIRLHLQKLVCTLLDTLQAEINFLQCIRELFRLAWGNKRQNNYCQYHLSVF